jgi:TRAP-type mannitol/chloroaromatic compound transport system permease small subunit
MRAALRVADRAVGGLLAAASWLALPIALLLFLQWPLRELVQHYAREANDLAQWLFALYVGIAISQATRVRAHLAIPGLSARLAPSARRRIARAGALLGSLPWALFVLIAAAPATWQSVRAQEAFPETYSPGYFMIRFAVWLLAALVAIQAIRDIASPPS